MPPPPNVRPVLPVASLDEAARFYRPLGFTVEPYDAGYAWVSLGGREVFHLRHAPGLVPGDNQAGLYLHVDDADGWHDTWEQAGAPVGPIADEPWGMREFSITDPSGNRIRVGHNR